ncbi:hypothetical protein BaRGS_00013259 [Batillaria attramentaria]|uniref:Uncharacterized protein n=1 Tax=Batillaria attramentaria TaxID=370345 RepID=A0ABD0L8G9_9CAEN
MFTALATDLQWTDGTNKLYMIWLDFNLICCLHLAGLLCLLDRDAVNPSCHSRLFTRMQFSAETLKKHIGTLTYRSNCQLDVPEKWTYRSTLNSGDRVQTAHWTYLGPNWSARGHFNTTQVTHLQALMLWIWLVVD